MIFPMENDFKKVKKIIKFALGKGIKVGNIHQSDKDILYYPLKKNKEKITAVIDPDSFLNYTTLLLNPSKQIKFLAIFICHELGHFFLSSSKRKRKINFGIPKEHPKVSRSYWDLDDEKANLVEFHLLKKFGYNYPDPAFFEEKYTTKVYQWWNQEGKEKFDAWVKS